MADKEMYIQWTEQTECPLLYVPAEVLGPAIVRKNKEQLLPALNKLRGVLVEHLKDKSPEETAALLVAMFGQEPGHEAQYLSRLATEGAVLLQKSADLDMIQRLLVLGATYVLNAEQAKEYGL